jgi:hypothetical protein
MPLTFPTQAEQCIADWRAITNRTVSLAAMARERGAFFEQMFDCKSFTFDDDTTIEIRGTGRNHKATAHLP